MVRQPRDADPHYAPFHVGLPYLVVPKGAYPHGAYFAGPESRIGEAAAYLSYDGAQRFLTVEGLQPAAEQIRVDEIGRDPPGAPGPVQAVYPDWSHHLERGNGHGEGVGL